MSHRLPAIDIAISVPARTFLQRIAELGRASGRFDVEVHQSTLGAIGVDAVNFRLLNASAHEELGFQVISKDADMHRVDVELRAFRWMPDPPTAVVYEDAARTLVSPLISTYNRTYATRYRIRIDKVSVKDSRLSVRSATLFDRFAILANTASLHPLDWRRFYRLVKEGRQEIDQAHLQAILVQKGFRPETAEHLADVYAHLWAFKRLR